MKSHHYAAESAASQMNELSINNPHKATVLSGHESEVFKCAWSPNVDVLASGSADGTVRIWEMIDNPSNIPRHLILGRIQRSEAVSNKDVIALAWKPDGNYIASGTFDGLVHIWGKNGDYVTTLGQHKGPIFALKWNHIGNFIVTAGADSKIVVWDFASGKYVQKISVHNAPVLDVDWVTENIFASCSSDHTIQINKLFEQSPLKTFVGHTSDVNSVMWNPQGDLLASCSSDMSVKIWSMEQDECVADLQGHTKKIYVIKWSPTGPGTAYPNVSPILATASFDDTVRLWDVAKQACLHVLAKHANPVYTIAFSPNGKYLASGAIDNTIYMWSTETGNAVHSYRAGGGVYDVSWNSTGTKMGAGSSDGSVIVLEFHMT